MSNRCCWTAVAVTLGMCFLTNSFQTLWPCSLHPVASPLACAMDDHILVGYVSWSISCKLCFIAFWVLCNHSCLEVLDNEVWLVSLGFDIVLTCSFVSRIHNIFNNFIHISIHTVTPVHAFSACLTLTLQEAAYCMFQASAWQYNMIHNIENSVKNITVRRLSQGLLLWLTEISKLFIPLRMETGSL